MPHKTTLQILFLIIISIACSTPKDQDNKPTKQLEEIKYENIMEGKIVSKTFTNKGGKEISTIQDLYFATEDETYFIKFMDSNITYEEAKALIDQPLQIIGEIRDGFWDIPDADPAYAQSRTGIYLVILEIK